MEKKRSVGVTIFSLLLFIFGLLTLFYAYKGFTYQDSTDSVAIKQWGFLAAIPSIPFFIAAILTFKLKKTGRIMNVILSPVTAFMIWMHLPFVEKIHPLIQMRLYYLSLLIFTTLIIYFFTRPKVKEQFRSR